jgi:hypothetical protein
MNMTLPPVATKVWLQSNAFSGGLSRGRWCASHAPPVYLIGDSPYRTQTGGCGNDRAAHG